MQESALAGMRQQVPQGLGQNARDVYMTRAGVNATQYARDAAEANRNYAVARQSAARQLALAGLQQMGEAQQAASQYSQSLAGSLLGGLFR
jgi:hypothetical protein